MFKKDSIEIKLNNIQKEIDRLTLNDNKLLHQVNGFLHDIDKRLYKLEDEEEDNDCGCSASHEFTIHLPLDFSILKDFMKTDKPEKEKDNKKVGFLTAFQAFKEGKSIYRDGVKFYKFMATTSPTFSVEDIESKHWEIHN